MTKRADRVCEIDSFLMSCRVIGRTVETAILSFLVTRNRALGVESIEGWFLPTAKNAPASGFYRDHGFQMIEERDGASRWSLAAPETAVNCPPWIELIFPKEFTLSEYVHA